MRDAGAATAGLLRLRAAPATGGGACACFPARRDNGEMEEPGGSPREGSGPPTEAAGSALSAFAAAALGLIGDEHADGALAGLVHAVALGTGAELVVARLVEADGKLVARAVHSSSAALAAELQGSRLPASEAPQRELGLDDAPGDPGAPPGVRRTASRARLPVARLVPVIVRGELVATLEALPFRAPVRVGRGRRSPGLPQPISRSRSGSTGRLGTAAGIRSSRPTSWSCSARLWRPAPTSGTQRTRSCAWRRWPAAPKARLSGGSTPTALLRSRPLTASAPRLPTLSRQRRAFAARSASRRRTGS